MDIKVLGLNPNGVLVNAQEEWITFWNSEDNYVQGDDQLISL